MVLVVTGRWNVLLWTPRRNTPERPEHVHCRVSSDFYPGGLDVFSGGSGRTNDQLRTRVSHPL